ncbi:BlaI/MecI/CopY family transcriptional regulator [Enterococcus sp. 669A]|uniref:BlaI/MecI/CopY family transcriptional regulator n=1 Tax=Candidatus Enterococcus moelleringii TaxID=2815325 RepID=A0ABS3L5Z0_9ENTE|nr:BlaI/MecI/CopY family transcriptional regulator [Enterococcus sp. 669A]MBO1305039.1 BlaI/MecI/CopY family transcriptional regulator [Enterococcus sp. 669A]
MVEIKKLPDAEFEVMKVIWHSEIPVVGNTIVEKLGLETKKEWKLQTVHKLLSRLEERGFLRSEKNGKQRFFTPLIMEEDYLQYEAQNFVKSHYEGSLLNLVNAMYQGKNLDEQDLDELQEWLDERSKRDD